MMESGRTAILYFACRPDVEASRKPIFSNLGHQVNVQFYRELQQELFGQLSPLGLPLIHIDDQAQRGTGFSDRICNAIDDVWALGFDKVLIIGNDVPELDTQIYQRAIELLSSNSSCLLRTQNGGAGLIGLQRKQFNREHWEELEWQSENTFDELFDCLPACRVLDFTATELNTLSDVYSYLELRRGKDAIAYLIESILNPLRNFVSLQYTDSSPGVFKAHKLRGPPFKC